MQATETQGARVRDQLGSRERASGLTCPWCHGGRTQERSLLAWRDGVTLRAKCKRAKCNRYGAWDSVNLGMRPPAQGSGAAGKRYVLDTLPLTDATQAYLQQRYRLSAGTLTYFGLRQGPSGTAVYCPVRGPGGQQRGWVRRWLNGTLPKVKGYPGPEHPEGAAWQAWFHTDPKLTRRLVVCVEDVFSAMRLWEVGIASVSLLGVSLTPVKLAELRRFASSIVVALDADAFTLAISAALRFHIHVRRIEPDIKDMTEEQLAQWTHALYSSLPASNLGTLAPLS
jgi:hypothetical protein